ncbi:MAG: dihydrofolate reductase [Pyrinomonadaceae bacterium]
MAIIGIVAVAQNLAIGRDGKLPWRYSSDLKFFKQTTTGHAVVMGWKTWASIEKPLPNRLNIVLSHNQTIENKPSVLLMRDREEVLELHKFLNCDLCIIGGAGVYETFKNHIEKWIVTEIPQTVQDADTFMPNSFLEGFGLIKTQNLEDDLEVKFYERLC